MDNYDGNKKIEIISGSVEDVSFQREDTGFTVMSISFNEELVNCVGVMPKISCGETVELTGQWGTHPSFGRQFKVEACRQTLPVGSAAILRYLASGAIHGIGEVMAEKIVSQFGEKTFDVIENEPDRLSMIKGISKKMALKFANEFKKQFEIRQTMIALTEIGLTLNEALDAYRVFKNEAVDFIMENPYILCQSDVNMTFDRVDKIADNVPEPPAFYNRASAGIIYALKHNLGIGHTCLPRHQMLKPCMELLQCGEDEVEIIIDDLIESRQIISVQMKEKDFLFLPEMYLAELHIAERFKLAEIAPPLYTEVYHSEIASFEQAYKIHLDEQQRKAIETAVKKGVLILTGGPGTGKTTTVKGIITLMKQRDLKVALAAPTGRAAKRMTELTGFEAKTIHRLLEVSHKGKSGIEFVHNSENVLDLDAVIVDEMSMVDALLFEALLDALTMGCRIIMVGDSDQLPPVGAGNVLQDLIKCEKIPVVKLERIFRQENQSMIVENAHMIVRGKMPDLTCRDKNSDFFFMQERNGYIGAKKVVELYTSRLPKAYGLDVSSQIQVLCPSRIGETGANNLNKMLQEKLNPKATGKSELAYMGYVLREGDKVMQIKNNYDVPWVKSDEDGTGVYNGDIGMLESIDVGKNKIIVSFDGKRAIYSLDSARELELAYAMTVHKSQGSEFDCVIMPVMSVPKPLCYRNLIYTCITRAKTLMVVLGNPETVTSMVENDKKTRRYSALKYFMTDETNLLDKNQLFI